MISGRVMIAAPSSGSGKTIITCGLLSFLKSRGVWVRSFKCGPDYIDPMFHRRVIGIPGGNLDTFFSGSDEIRHMVSDADSDAVVIEGVMGLYDGITGSGGQGSAYEVARVTDTPIILVIDVRGMGETMLSVIKGILIDDECRLIRGIVLNRISPHYFETIRPLISDMLERISDERGSSVRLLGGIPGDKKIHLESRHLGLMMPGEIEDIQEQVRRAQDLIEDNLDLDILGEIMGEAVSLRKEASEIASDAEPSGSLCAKRPGECLVLAAARDEAFCFYYEENLRMLEEAGITIREFSPLHDKCIPEEADGLLLGGGYPELYAKMLSDNISMRQSILGAIRCGMPSMAECGGFMYLMDELECEDGSSYPMAGVLGGRSYYTGRLGRFGYVTVSGRSFGSGQQAESMISGLSIRGHEFHYYDSTNNGSDAAAVKPGSGRSWECIHASKDHVWGYPHLYYPSCPELIERLAGAMRAYRESKE